MNRFTSHFDALNCRGLSHSVYIVTRSRSRAVPGLRVFRMAYHLMVIGNEHQQQYYTGQGDILHQNQTPPAEQPTAVEWHLNWQVKDGTSNYDP